LALSALLLAGVGCQSAKKPSSSLKAFQAATPSAQTVQAKAPAAPTQVVPTEVDPNAKAKTPAPPQADRKPAAPKVDAVADLVASAEKEYQAGNSEFAAGHNDAAKQHFDAAFNQLQGSPFELHSDARFQREFECVVEALNKLDTATQAEGQSEEKSEPAPIDEANEVNNYPVDPNLKAKAAAEIEATHSDLPLMMTDQVASYINYFSNRGRGVLEHGLERSGRYREMIERVLKQEGVPGDLIYLAQAESGFHPYAVSRVGARGIWQFMGSRARAYDLNRDFWVDERQDPEKSTRAAARHLKDLYNEFGDWYLAMAAYNSGPGTVQSAVKRTGYADFWQLYERNVLPRETRNYVPIILAVTIMAKNPEQYGLDSIAPDPAMAYDTVKINYPVNLKLVADCVDVTPEELLDLNPSLLRTVTPKGGFELHLPVGTTEKYEAVMASIPPDMRVSWRYHKVAPGETLMSVARSFHTTVHAISDANQIGTDSSVEAGAKLVIPVTPSKHSDVQTYAKRLTVYRVRKGDTVERVSENLGVPAITIRRWNRLKSDSLAGRRVLYVHLPVSPATASHETLTASKSRKANHLIAASSNGGIHHTVKRGETLYSIASNYKTSVEAIQQSNAHVATLRPGMVLLIPAQ
jgi:membrane-bound lytic murein transglycosylase D